jgi:ProP effector
MSKAKSKRLAAVATITQFAERWPAAFFILDARRKPLKVGVFDDIVAAAPEIDKRAVKRALAVYCSGGGYLRSVRAGAARVGLDGVAAGAVTAEDATFALGRLAARAKRKAAATAPAKPPPAIAKPPKPKAALSTSLAGLRESARRRAAS